MLRTHHSWTMRSACVRAAHSPPAAAATCRLCSFFQPNAQECRSPASPNPDYCSSVRFYCLGLVGVLLQLGALAIEAMTGLSEEERQAQKAYWKEHSENATVEAMMLDSKAADIDKLERPEASRPRRICCDPAAGHQ